ncbi:hypothetical protein PAMP_017887 [Pampus punctatissimus]
MSRDRLGYPGRTKTTLCQGQGRAAGPRLSGASAHLGKFRLNSSTFLNTQLIETLTNSNPRARPQMGREPRQHSQRGREREGGGRGRLALGPVNMNQTSCSCFQLFLVCSALQRPDDDLQLIAACSYCQNMLCYLFPGCRNFLLRA